MSLSVLLPVYNGAWCVAEAIDSVLQQTMQNFELLICDDGSTDESWQICKRYQRVDSRIVLIRNGQNRGLAFTLNRLTASAKGIFIGIQEQDDLSTISRFEKQITVLKDNPHVGLVASLAARVGDDREIFSITPSCLIDGRNYPSDRIEMVRGLLTRDISVVHSSCMFRRSISSLVNGPFDGEARCSIDWQFFIRLAHHCQFWGIPEVLVHLYRGSRQTLTSDTALVSHEAHRCLALLWNEWRNAPGTYFDEPTYRRALDAQLCADRLRSKSEAGLP